MTLYPRVMAKAQHELDSVIGTGRLPTFSDRPSLPYVEALFTELLRWHNPTPLSKFSPHAQRRRLLIEAL
jgi:cytochrome P450